MIKYKNSMQAEKQTDGSQIQLLKQESIYQFQDQKKQKQTDQVQRYQKKNKNKHGIIYYSSRIFPLLLLCYIFGYIILTDLTKLFKERTQDISETFEQLNYGSVPGKKYDWASSFILNSQNIYSNIQSDQDLIVQPQTYYQWAPQNFMSRQLQELVKSTRYYDIHYFVEDTNIKNQPRIAQKAKKRQKYQINEKRPLIKIMKSNQQLDLLINKMMQPEDRPDQMPDWQVFKSRTKQQLDLIYYFYELSSNPQNIDYLETEYYRYNKLYNIGEYGKQLPLCIVVVGRNNDKILPKMYDSIKRQNYTNYRVIHVDDNSNDDTIDIAIKYFAKNSFLRDRVTIVTQRYQRNALYNRNYGINNYCHDGDIVIDMDADDWIIGKQVFQLVNSLYQAGNVYKGKRYQLWNAYLTNMGYIRKCCPHASIFGQIDQNVLDKQLYRSQGKWRTTELRTYLWKLYQKVDKKDMVDDLMLKKGQFHVQTYDSYMQSGMVEMANPKHMKILDEIVYFYTGSPSKASYIQVYYSTIVAKTLTPYERIQRLDQSIVRNKFFTQKSQNIAELNKQKKQISQKRKKLKQDVLRIYKRDRNFYNNFQKRSVFKKKNQGKILGEQQIFKTSISQFNQFNLIPQFNYSQYGMDDAIQVGSQFDYLNISQSINFTELQIKMFDSVAHEILQFKFNKSLQTQRTNLKYKIFANQQQIQSFLKNASAKNPKNIQVQNDIQYYLASLLAGSHIEPKTKQLEYYYLNKKYKIGQNKQQIPMCIYAAGYNLINQNKYKKFFETVERLNYSNFHIVHVDDYSPDNSSYEIYKYLQKSSMRIKNRIKIVRNLQRIQILANFHVWIKRLCNPDDVVIILDADDSIIGIQTLQILNSLYKNPENWYVYSRFVMVSQYPDRFWIGPSSKPLPEPLLKYRSTQNSWVSSHLRSFRKKVLDAVPIQHFIQFYYNKTEQNIYPRYHRSSADRYLAYSLLQVCGQDRIHFITDFLYLYNPNRVSDCHRAHQMFQQYKSRIKTPLLPLQSQQNKSLYSNKTQLIFLLDKMKQHYIKYLPCKQQLHIK